MREHQTSLLSPAILETELADLYRKERLEPGCDDATVSMAVSLRRIADALEGTPRKKFDDVQFGMIVKLKDRHRLPFNDALKIAMDYFKRILE